MVARLSDLDDQKPGINIQTEGYTLTPSSSQMALKIQRHLVVPHHIHHPSLWQENQYLIGLRLRIVWKYKWPPPKMGSDATTSSHMAGTYHGRHGLRWQIWPDRSCSNQPRQGHSVLWVAIIRRTELGQYMRCCVHTVRSHQVGWQTSPTQHQTGKPG